jgi:glycosyltransferase involved in cell wall biosynthesis
MAMHVLQLGPYPPPEGGISRNMLAIRDELLARGDGCSIIATSRSSQTSDEPDVYHPGSAAALLRLLGKLNFDILHLHIGGEVSSRVLALAFACTFFAKGKSVLTLHSGAFPQSEAAKNASPGSIRGLIFRRFRRLIGVNEPIAKVFERYGVPPERIAVIAPFALKPPSPDVSVPDDLAGFYSSHSPVMLALGGLEKDYEPLLQIEAVGEVLKTYPNAGLIIVGDGSMRKEVDAAIEASGYADSIKLTGNIDHGVVLHLICDADMVLRTTLFDGDAISVREALFLGTPVIATDNNMRPAGVHLVPTSDKAALVSEILSVAVAGKAQPAEASSNNSNIEQVLKIYREIN